MGFQDEAVRVLIEYRDKVHDGDSQAAATALSVAPPTFWRRCNKKNVPTLKALAKAFDQLGAKVWVPGEPPIEDRGYALVPRVEAVAGAGESLETSGAVAGLYAFRREFFDRLGIHAKKCVMMYVRGNSMEPLIRDGDTILVDESQREPRDGDIFCVGLGDALMVKRLQKIPAGWNLCSENKSIPPVAVTHGDLESFRVYGRVRWFGRVL